MTSTIRSLSYLSSGDVTVQIKTPAPHYSRHGSIVSDVIGIDWIIEQLGVTRSFLGVSADAFQNVVIGCVV